MRSYTTPKDYICVCLDAETFYDDGYSLRKMATAAYVADPRFKVHLWAIKWGDQPGSWISHEGMRKLSTTVNWSKVAIFGHNLRFDGLILARHYGINPGLWVDTLGMARAVLGGSTRSHGLDALAKHIGRGGKIKSAALAAVKGKRDLTREELLHLANYAVDDVEDTVALFHWLKPDFPEQEYWFLDWATRMTTEPKLVLNRSLLEQGLKTAQQDRRELLDRVPYTKTSLASQPQFAKILRGLGVEPPTKISKTTGEPTYAFAKSDIEFMELAETGSPDVQDAIAARLAVKSTGAISRMETFLSICDIGPWSTPLNYAGAMNTLRFSGGDGQNPQNIPNRSVLRDAVEAPEGHVCVVVDSTGIELRVGATICGQMDIIERAKEDGDEYARFAEHIFHHPVTKADNPRERKVGKVGVLSLGYQSGGRTYRGMLYAMEKLVEPLDVCKTVVATFRNIYSQYPWTWKRLGTMLEMMAKGFKPPNLPTNPPITWSTDGFQSKYSGARVKYPMLGRRIMKFGLEEVETMCYLDMRKAKAAENAGWANIYGGKVLENMSQFLAREVVNYQTYRIWQLTGLRPQLQVHDELIFVVPAEKAEAVYAIVKAVMSAPVPWWPELVVAASGGIAKSYGGVDK